MLKYGGGVGVVIVVVIVVVVVGVLVDECGQGRRPLREQGLELPTQVLLDVDQHHSR